MLGSPFPRIARRLIRLVARATLRELARGCEQLAVQAEACGDGCDCPPAHRRQAEILRKALDQLRTACRAEADRLVPTFDPEDPSAYVEVREEAIGLAADLLPEGEEELAVAVLRVNGMAAPVEEPAIALGLARLLVAERVLADVREIAAGEEPC